MPVVNLNRAEAEELRVLSANPDHGTTRNDNFIGVQELFVDKHLRDVSARYDFDSVRVGIQPFIADFRGFLFLDQPFGVRLFGTRDNNRWQYNAAWFRRLEKDTNSGLNDITHRLRADDIFASNLYRQDWPVPGFTSQAIVLHNRNREGDGQFLQRATASSSARRCSAAARPHNYDVTYLGSNGDGHFGRWNLSASVYYAFGDDERDQLSGRAERIRACFAAAELSRDFDWVRLRLTALYASGDRDPFDGKAHGLRRDPREPAVRRRRHELLDPPGGAARRRRRRRALEPERRAARRCAPRRSTGSRTSSTRGCASSASAPTSTSRPSFASSPTSTTCASTTSPRSRRCATRSCSSGDIGWDVSVGAAVPALLHPERRAERLGRRAARRRRA